MTVLVTEYLHRDCSAFSGENMKVLLVHNRYQQRGGEDAVVDAEACLLADRGVQVQRLDADNDAIQGALAKIRVSANQFSGSPDMRQRIGNALQTFRPDVVHVHNWFPTISASIFRQCKTAGIPVVHTIHNYRLLCVGATLFRDGHVCEDCIGATFRTPGIRHKCYRGSGVGSAAATMGMLTHWAAGTWHQVRRPVHRAHRVFAQQSWSKAGFPKRKSSSSRILSIPSLSPERETATTFSMPAGSLKKRACAFCSNVGKTALNSPRCGSSATGRCAMKYKTPRPPWVTCTGWG